MPAGLYRRSGAALRGLPLPVPSTESNRPRVPIWMSSFPSWLYFWMMPSPLAPTHTLLSRSKVQPWMEFGDHLRVAPGVDQRAGGVEHQDGRGLLGGFFFFVGDVAAVDYYDVIVGVGADAAELAGDPAGGQGLGPGGIDFKLGRILRAALPARRLSSKPARGVLLMWLLFKFFAAEVDGFDVAHVGDIVERIIGDHQEVSGFAGG